MDHGKWRFSMVQLLKKLVLKALGPSLGVNWMWTKKNDHAPKNECVDLFWYMFEKGILGKKSSLTIFLSSLGLYLSSLLVKCVEDVACKSSHNNFYKENEQFNQYMFNVVFMWHVPCVVTTLNIRILCVCLYLVLLPLYLTQH